MKSKHVLLYILNIYKKYEQNHCIFWQQSKPQPYFVEILWSYLFSCTLFDLIPHYLANFAPLRYQLTTSRYINKIKKCHPAHLKSYRKKFTCQLFSGKAPKPLIFVCQTEFQQVKHLITTDFPWEEKLKQLDFCNLCVVSDTGHKKFCYK